MSPIDNLPLERLKSTINFKNKHPEIIFTCADKGNTTIALDRNNYRINMQTILNDNNTYSVIKKNPSKKIENELNNMLKLLLDNNHITTKQSYTLRSSDKLLPKVYGTPKIHKQGFPLRVSFVCE